VLFVFACILGNGFWPPALATLVWAPAILLCIEKLARGWSWRWWIGLALVTCLQFLAGFTQYSVYTWYLALPYALSRLVAEAATGRLARRPAFLCFGGILAAVALAAGLAAVQLLPTLELVGETHRAQPLTAEQVHYGFVAEALPLGGLLRNALDPSPGLVTPGYGYDQGYLGMSTLVLLAAGLACARRSVVWPLVLVALASFFLSTGYRGPLPELYALYAKLPTGSTFRDPQRFRALFFFCVIALATPGFEAFSRGFAELRRRRLAAGFALGGALGVTFAAVVAGGPGAAARAAATLGLAACVLVRPQRGVRIGASLALLALLVADLHHAIRPGSGSFRAVPTAWLESLYYEDFGIVGPREIARLARDAGTARLAAPFLEPSLGLGALGAAYRVECLDPLAPAAWNELQEEASGLRDPRFLMSRLPPRRLATAYDLAGVRTIVGVVDARSPARGGGGKSREAPGPDPVPPKGLEPRITPNEDALPRAYLVRHWQVQPRSAAIERVVAGDFDFRRSVILDREPPGLGPAVSPAALEPAAIVAYAPERVEIDVHAAQPGLLVLTDTYYPGWRAYVDGAEVEVLRANGLFRAVALAAGDHRVRFEYRPQSLRIGAAISAACAVLIVAIPLAARAFSARSRTGRSG
jgi:hypothetical protein